MNLVQPILAAVFSILCDATAEEEADEDEDEEVAKTPSSVAAQVRILFCSIIQNGCKYTSLSFETCLNEFVYILFVLVTNQPFISCIWNCITTNFLLKNNGGFKILVFESSLPFNWLIDC